MGKKLQNTESVATKYKTFYWDKRGKLAKKRGGIISKLKRERKSFSMRVKKTLISSRVQGLAVMVVTLFVVNSIFIISPIQVQNKIFPMYRETNTGDDYVDNISDVDNNPDKGSHSNFDSLKLKDDVYDEIQEENMTRSGADITFDFTSYSISSGSTASWSHTVGNMDNRLLVIGATWKDYSSSPPSCTSVTYNGVQLTELVDEYIASGSPTTSQRITLWYMLNPPPGSYTVQVTASSNPDRDIIAFSASYFGVYQGPPNDYEHYSSTSNPISITLTALKTNSTAVFVCGCGNEGTWTAIDSNSTIREQISQDYETGCFGDSDNIPSGDWSIGADHNYINRGIIAGACWKPATAMITHESDTYTTSSGSTASWSHTVGNMDNRLLVVGATWENNSSIPPSCTSVTYNGVQLTELVDEYIASGSPTTSQRVTLWYMLNPPPGSYTVQVTASSNPEKNIIAFATSYFGVYQGPPDDYDLYNSTSNPISVTLTALEDNSVGVFVCGCGNEGTWTAMDSNSTIREQISQYSESGCFGDSDNIPSGNRSVGVDHNDVNRAIIAGACWRPATFEGINYGIDLEIQWTSVDTSESNYRLAIYCGIFNTTENIEIYIWFGQPSQIWLLLASDLNENSWNNITITPFINSTITIRFLGGKETVDTTLSAWDIDVAIIYGWTPDIPTVLTVDKTSITIEPGETAVFNITYTDDSQDIGITGANLTYFWDYGSGQLEEMGDGVYMLSISTSSLDEGTYYIDISASLEDYQSQSFQLSLVIFSSKVVLMEEIRDLFPYIALLILGAFGSIITMSRYTTHKQELYDREKIRRIMVIFKSFALYDQTPSGVIAEEESVIDKNLVSGFFTAIKNITEEVAGTTLKTMKVYPTHPYYFVYTSTFYCVLILSDKPSKQLEEKLLCFAEDVEEKYGNIYSSDTLGFLDIQLNLNEEVIHVFGITPSSVLQDIITISLSYEEIEEADLGEDIKKILRTARIIADLKKEFFLEDLMHASKIEFGSDIKKAQEAFINAMRRGFLILSKSEIKDEKNRQYRKKNQELNTPIKL